MLHQHIENDHVRNRSQNLMNNFQDLIPNKIILVVPLVIIQQVLFDTNHAHADVRQHVIVEAVTKVKFLQIRQPYTVTQTHKVVILKDPFVNRKIRQRHVSLVDFPLNFCHAEL